MNTNIPLRTLAQDIVSLFGQLETRTRLQQALTQHVSSITDTSFGYNIWASANGVFKSGRSSFEQRLRTSYEVLNVMQTWLRDLRGTLAEGRHAKLRLKQ